MDVSRFGVRWRTRLAGSALATLAFAAVAAVPWSDSRAGTAPTYSIDFHRIGSGGSTLRGNCFRLAGTVAEVAPGYSSGSTISILAGFWLAAPIAGQDQIFFNGFEGC